ncbi:hypothetical protein Pcinc_003688 [Petrolisthes cinctipes]|uniref:Uncharacterized protein n=1 Tax=Petrolisthes cinctipes TaxID=88211 RepID=A0AAE1GGV4_PETCI|nr:hypothetical protein Pcinc_003688 [Petrolisthes cinctipes]
MANGRDEAMVVLDGASVPSTSRAAITPTYRQKRKQSGLWSEAQATCRVLVFDFSDGNILAGIRLLEWAALWTQPDTRLVAMGESVGVTTLLLHSTLRNTLHALYVTKKILGYESKRGNTTN